MVILVLRLLQHCPQANRSLQEESESSNANKNGADSKTAGTIGVVGWLGCGRGITKNC
jgi:hypothetical protein